MIEIKLSSPKYKIVKLNRKTKAKGFCDLKVGDIIYFQTEIAPTGRNGNHLYAAVIDCLEATTNKYIGSFTYNSSPKYLNIFELEEV